MPLFTNTLEFSREEKENEEKYVNLFKMIGIDKGFYYSYTYDLTRSLQENILRKASKKEKTQAATQFRSKSQAATSPRFSGAHE